MVADERFVPTSGRVSGLAGIAIALMILGYAFVPADSDIAAWGVAAALLVAAVSWTALLKPGLAITEGRLVMRNMFTTVEIPLHRIDSVAVRQFTAVLVDGKRFVCAAIGRSRKQIHRDNPPPGRASSKSSRIGGLGLSAFGLSAHAPDVGQGEGPTRGRATHSYGFYVQEKIQRAVEETKKRRVADDVPGEVTTRVAWLEVVLVAGTLIATVVLILA